MPKRAFLGAVVGPRRIIQTNIRARQQAYRPRCGGVSGGVAVCGGD